MRAAEWSGVFYSVLFLNFKTVHHLDRCCLWRLSGMEWLLNLRFNFIAQIERKRDSLVCWLWSCSFHFVAAFTLAQLVEIKTKPIWQLNFMLGNFSQKILNFTVFSRFRFSLSLQYPSKEICWQPKSIERHQYLLKASTCNIVAQSFLAAVQCVF